MDNFDVAAQKATIVVSQESVEGSKQRGFPITPLSKRDTVENPPSAPKCAGESYIGCELLNAMHLEAHQTAASLIKMGMFFVVSGEPKAD